MKSQHKSGSQNMAQFGPHLIMLNTEAVENVYPNINNSIASTPSLTTPTSSVLTFSCDQCELTFKQKFTLNRHQKEVQR